MSQPSIMPSRPIHAQGEDFHAPTASRLRFRIAELRPAVRPFRLHWFARLRSTNDHAALLRRRGELFVPAIVLTGRQLAGRGRGANAWWSAAGVLTVTFALPVDARLSPQQLPLLAGLIVRDAAAEITGAPQIQVKWPNDILCDGRKLAGLLCERVRNADLIGLGMNVNLDPAAAPPPLHKSVTSLSRIAAQPIDPNAVLIHLARRLHQALARRDETSFAAALRNYDQHHALLGQAVSIQNGAAPPIVGHCEGIDTTGRLLVRSGDHLHRIVTGHVILRK